MSRVAFAWARKIPAPFDVRGALLEISMQAAEETHVLRAHESKLAAIFGGCGVSTLRLMLNYLIGVGALERLSGQGSHHGLQLRVCVEVSPEQIAERIERAPSRTPHRRIAGDDRQNGHRRIAGDEGMREMAVHTELLAMRELAQRRIVGDEQLAHARALSFSSSTGSTGLSSEQSEQLPSALLSPKATRAPARAREAPTLTSDERRKLHERWDKALAPTDVDESIQLALAHDSARKYGATGWYLYVNGWIRRDVERRPATMSSNAHAASNGHLRGNNSRYKGDAQELSELPNSIMIGQDEV